MPKTLALLGSTGSVGEQSLAVAGEFPERYRVAALAAGRNIEKLAGQVAQFRPALVSVADAGGAHIIVLDTEPNSAVLSIAEGTLGFWSRR